MGQAYDSSKMTDMEVALSLLRLFDDTDLLKIKETSSIKRTCVQMVENAVETFTNPFAKNLLIAKLAEQN